MSSSSAPDSGSSGFKEGSSDSKKRKKLRRPRKSSAAVPVVSLEASKESVLSSTGTTVSVQQDETWSYKGMSKKEVTDQIVFLNKTLRDMVVKIVELKSKKLALIEKPDKSTNDMLVLDEVKEQLIKIEDFKAKYEAELRELQEVVGSSTTVITSKADFSDLLWKETLPREKVMFSSYRFGGYILDRKRLIDKTLFEIKFQRSRYFRLGICQSIYIYGCRGMGKTCNLMLISKALKNVGYEVYYFSTAVDISKPFVDYLIGLLSGSPDKLFAVILDEITPEVSQSVMNKLLRCPHKNLVVIGAAVPSEVKLGITANFYSKFGLSTLALREDDSDFLQLIDSISSDNPVLTSKICRYILNQCGGHLFPTLSFIESFHLKRDKFNSYEKFFNYFNGSAFTKTINYKEVLLRCFIDDHSTDHVANVLCGIGTQDDFKALERVGWWNRKKKQFISVFIKNLCLISVILPTDEPKILFQEGKHEKNALLAITTGFSMMQASDFLCISTDKRKPIESALSFRWATYVSSEISNATLRFQETSGVAGYVDFHLNGYADCAVEFIRNATKTRSRYSRQSTDINEHLARFTSGKYHWQRFFIVNFSIEGDAPVLPDDAAYHDRVLTYVHSTNTLYRGNAVFRSPAVKSLPCPMKRK